MNEGNDKDNKKNIRKTKDREIQRPDHRERKDKDKKTEQPLQVFTSRVLASIQLTWSSLTVKNLQAQC